MTRHEPDEHPPPEQAPTETKREEDYRRQALRIVADLMDRIQEFLKKRSRET